MSAQSFRYMRWAAMVVSVWLVMLPPVVTPSPTSSTAAVDRLPVVSGTARASILVYHRFGPVVADAMTVRTVTFRRQLEYLKAHDYRVVPLRTIVAWRMSAGPPPPHRAVVITVDDGHRSVFTDMLPLAREFDVPVTAFIYPSAISNASYAMTWPQLAVLTASGLFDIQSHTYWHPNFAIEKRRRATADYHTFAMMQLTRPTVVLGEKLGVHATVIAWPFGIYDDELLGMAGAAGYAAGVTLDRRLVTGAGPIMALPRFLVTDAMVGKSFASLLPEERP